MKDIDELVDGLEPRDLDEILDRAGPALERLRGARLFITGGTGFFGQWLLASLCHANARLGLGVEAVVLTRDPEGFRARVPWLARDPAIELWPGDVRFFEFPKGRFTHVVHAATDTGHTDANQSLNLIDAVITGTRRVLEFARAAGVRRLLYLSSGGVYGAMPPGLEAFAEEYSGGCDPLDPRSSYSEAKRVAEHLCCLYGEEIGLESVVARGFSFVGPLMSIDAHFAIGNFVRDALFGDAIHVRGDGTAQRSYLYAGDLAAWLWVMLVEGVAGRAYNVGSDEAVDIRGLAATVAAELAPRKPVTVARQSTGPEHRNRYVPAIRRAREELGLEVWTDLATAVRRTGEWYRARGLPTARRSAGRATEAKTFVVDFDGVLATLVPGNDYALAGPLVDNIAAINRLYDAGHRIILFTARGSATGIDWRATTEGQCSSWGIRFHELRFGKPAADYYVDDRLISISMLHAMADADSSAD